jgi:hypothetical protein
MALTFEKIAEVAQKYVSTCPVIVLGTGASIPQGLPSMSDLAELLVRRIPEPQESIDKTRWEAFKDQLMKLGDLERALHEIELTPFLLGQVIHETWRIIIEKDVPVRDAVLANTSHLPLTRLFRHLLRTAHGSISVITTNYDRTTEYAANAADAVCFTGFTPGLFGGFISDTSLPRCEIKCPGSEGHIFLWKVHGSLDWFENSSKEPLAINGAWSIPSSHRPLIVTPGLTKYRETHLDPFRTVIARADSTLEQAKSYLCIGFGFNDEHIQPKLLSKLSKNDIPIVIVTKTLSATGRDLLLKKPSKKFLIFEEAVGGTKVYHPDSIDGEILAGHSLWSLAGFLDMIIGPTEGGDSHESFGI